jgi:hypothetical protein
MNKYSTDTMQVRSRRSHQVLGIFLLVIGLLWLLTIISWIPSTLDWSKFFWPLILIFAGLLWFNIGNRRKERNRDAATCHKNLWGQTSQIFSSHKHKRRMSVDVKENVAFLCSVLFEFFLLFYWFPGIKKNSFYRSPVSRFG